MPRKSTLGAEQVEKTTELLKAGVPISKICKDVGISAAQANHLKRKLGLVQTRKAKAAKAPAKAKRGRTVGRKPGRKAGRKPGRVAGARSSLAVLRGQLAAAMTVCQKLQAEIFEKTIAIEAMIQKIINA